MIERLEQEVLKSIANLKALNIYRPDFHVTTDSLVALGNALSLTERSIVELGIFQTYLESCKKEIIEKIHLLKPKEEST